MAALVVPIAFIAQGPTAVSRIRCLFEECRLLSPARYYGPPEYSSRIDTLQFREGSPERAVVGTVMRETSFGPRGGISRVAIGDTDGDTYPEYIVAFDWDETPRGQRASVFDFLGPGQLSRHDLTAGLDSSWLGEWPDLLRLHDVDHDGAYEIIVSTYDGATGSFRNLHLWTYEGSSYARMRRGDYEGCPYEWYRFDEFSWQDVDDDGVDELRLTLHPRPQRDPPVPDPCVAIFEVLPQN